MSTEQPIQAQFIEQMNAIASVLDEVLNSKQRPPKVGFALLCFNLEVDADSRTNYICNCERKDMLNAMKEFIARAEGRITDKEQLQ